MKILFFGDIYAKTGRSALRKVLPALREKLEPDFIIANVENLAHGRGPTGKQLNELKDMGVDGFTSGNHIFCTNGYEKLFSKNTFTLARPANYPSKGVPGKGYFVLKKGAKKLFVANLMGRIFMAEPLDNPFFAADKLVKEAKRLGVKNIFIDFHAEATSEKSMLGAYLDGRVGAVVGTHTHVQTSDNRVLPSGTAFISDAGFCGALNSGIGAKTETVLQRFLTGIPVKMEVAENLPFLVSGVLVELNNRGRAKSIERVYELVE